MKPLRLLLVEDEERLAGNLRQGLTEEGLALDWVKSAEEAEAMLARKAYDILVLDVGLPGKSGVDLLRERRAGGDTTPVLFLTARGALEDRVAGLESGGDDYLVCPRTPRELCAPGISNSTPSSGARAVRENRSRFRPRRRCCWNC
jgi:two-component system OmpR family response regulator